MSKEFFLKGLKSAVIYNEYNNGKYETFTLEHVKKFEFKFNTVSKGSLTAISKNSNSDVYMTNTFDNYRIFCTNNCEFFNSFSSTLKPETVCFWCRRKFSESPVGIPIKLERQENVWISYCITCNCTFECAYANLIQYLELRKVDFESKTMLLFMFDSMFPDQKLTQSPDWTLRKENGGSLEDSDYFSKTHKYVSTNKYLFVPVKTIYERIKNE